MTRSSKPFAYAAGFTLALGLLLRTRRPSLPMEAVKIYLRLRKLSTAPTTEESLRQRSAPQPAPIKAALRALCDVQERQVQGQKVFTLRPKGRKSDWHILYTHGGAYIRPLLSNHWDGLEALIKATGATVTVPTLPLAPEHTYQAAFAVLEEVYLGVLRETPPSKVVLMGDSAGGGLALAQAIRYRDLGLPRPGRVILFAPWLDITLADPASRKVEPRDVILGVDALREYGQWWAGGDDPRGPLLSPLYADLHDLPPIDVFQGTDDLLVVDARNFHRRASAAGAEVRLHETPGGFHVFMIAPMLPEAQEVYGQIGAALIQAAPGGPPPNF